MTIQELEDKGKLDPSCGTCRKYFYPKLEEGKSIGDIFAPQHKASERCQSGKHPHCTCDTCF